MVINVKGAPWTSSGHLLLQAAVEYGIQIESEIKKGLPLAGMTSMIKAMSRQSVEWS